MNDDTLSTQHFKATIATSGIKAYVVVPFEPSDVWGVRDRYYVTGSIDGYKIRGCLAPEGTQYILSLGAAWRRDNPVDRSGDVEVVLSADGPQSDTLAPDIATALETEPLAEMFFASLAPFYRKNFLRWIDSARRPETRDTRIREMMSLLRAGKRQR
jgi:hypothetical protein